MNENVALITADEVERVESVQDSKEDKLSSAGDSEEAESSFVGTKTDGELIEELLPGMYAWSDCRILQATRKIADVDECAFHSQV